MSSIVALATICYRKCMSLLRSSQLDKIWMFFAPLLVLTLGADQLSKDWALAHLNLEESTDLGLALTYNNGIVFGFDMPLAVIYFLTVAIVSFGTYLVIQNKLWRDHWHLAGLALLLAGAVGNLIDRIRFGYVIDFIKVYWWPTFNLADVWIVLAVLIFTWDALFRGERMEKL